VIDVIRNNMAWSLTGAVLVLVVFNVYVNIKHHDELHKDDTHPHHSLIERFDNNNNNESESKCPYTSIQ
jgi:hypothetical protein